MRNEMPDDGNNIDDGQGSVDLPSAYEEEIVKSAAKSLFDDVEPKKNPKANETGYGNSSLTDEWAKTRRTTEEPTDGGDMDKTEDNAAHRTGSGHVRIEQPNHRAGNKQSAINPSNRRSARPYEENAGVDLEITDEFRSMRRGQRGRAYGEILGGEDDDIEEAAPRRRERPQGQPRQAERGGREIREVREAAAEPEPDRRRPSQGPRFRPDGPVREVITNDAINEEDISDIGFDTFRPKEYPKETAPGARPGQKPPANNPLNRIASGTAKRNPGVRRGPVEDSEPIGYIRAIAAAVGLALLIILVVLTFRVVSLSGRLREAEGLLENLPANDGEINRYALMVESLEEENERLTNDVIRLENRIQEMQQGVYVPPQDDPGTVNNNDPPTSRPGDDTPDPPAQQERKHTVARGDTLSRIATTYYGSGSDENMQRIQNANTFIVDRNSLVVGWELTIP